MENKFYPDSPEFPPDLDELNEGPIEDRDPEAALDYRPGYCTACDGSGWPTGCRKCGECGGTNWRDNPKSCLLIRMIKRMASKPCEVCDGTGRSQEALHLDDEL